MNIIVRNSLKQLTTKLAWEIRCGEGYCIGTEYTLTVAFCPKQGVKETPARTRSVRFNFTRLPT